MPSLVRTLATVVGAAAVALVVVEIAHRLLLRFGRRSGLLTDLARQAHRPFQFLLALFAVQQPVRSAGGDFPGRDGVLHALVLMVIAAAAWLVAALVLVVEDVSLNRFRTDDADNIRARRLRTQVVMLRRVTVAAMVIVTVGVMPMTFPAVRVVGAALTATFAARRLWGRPLMIDNSDLRAYPSHRKGGHRGRCPERHPGSAGRRPVHRAAGPTGQRTDLPPRAR